VVSHQQADMANRRESGPKMRNKNGIPSHGVRESD